MKTLFCSICSASLLLGGSVLAGALDSPVLPTTTITAPQNTANDWSGFYIGAFAAYGTAGINHDYDNNVLFGYSADGISGGVQAGYNFQSGNMVYGIEADWYLGGETGSGLCDSGTTPACGGTGSQPTFTLDRTVGVKGRIGVVKGDMLFFGSAGWSQASITVTDTLQPATVSATHQGFTVGAGLEWMMNNGVIISAEYQYGVYGPVSYPLVTTPDTIDFTTGAVRVGVKLGF